MTILYIAKERRAAEFAASALPTVAPDVAVAWASDLDHGRRWIDEHRDVATIIVEVGTDIPSCEAFIHDLQARGVEAPVVAVSATGQGTECASLQAIAAEVVEKSPSFLADLPGAVSRALDSAIPTPGHRATARLADRRLALDAQLVDASNSLRTIEERLTETAAAIEQARKDHAAEVAGWADLHQQRTSELAERVAEAAAARQILEQQLAERAVALQHVTERAAEERQAAQALALRHEELETLRTRDLLERRAIEAQLAEAEATSARVEQMRVAEAAASAELSVQHRAEFEARLNEMEGQRAALEGQLAESLSRLEQARDDRAADVAAAAAVEKQLEQRLADADAALRHVEHRAAEAEANAHQEAAAQQAEIEAERSRSAAARQNFERQLVDAAAKLERSEEHRASDAHEAAVRLSEYQQRAEAQLTQAAAAIEALHIQRTELTAALDEAHEQVAIGRRAAEAQAAEREAIFESEFAREVAARQALEQALAQAQVSHARAADHHAEALAASVQQFAEYERHTGKRLAESDAAGVALQAMLADAAAELHRFEQHHAAVMGEAAARHADYQTQTEGRMAQASAMLNVLKAKLAERAEALKREQQQAASECQAAAEEVAELTRQLARSEADANASAERAERGLVETVASMRQSARTREALLEKRAVRTTQQLQKQLEGLVADLATNRRRFDHSPASLCRCERDGTIERANQALADLVGYSTPEELQRIGLSAVFETGDELQWLVNRCLASRSPESIETTWRTQDGRRIIVNVVASATAQDAIDLTVQDITTRRSLEEKLRHSQRIEAVGRYASEVALTCDSVLGNVTQEAQRIATGSDGGVVRHQAEMVLEDVTRASALLRRLAIYGEEENNAPALVDLHRVLRDLAPVLKRVAGSHIELVLPKLSTPHNLDVDAERVERILVNIAAYGRQRMPVGGRLTFELASVVVERAFVEKYPNVRPGTHVLLTVTERSGAVDDATAGGGNTGVDLGTLQALVGDSGGHLWMTVEPTGDMVLKIHLPRRVLDAPELLAPARPQGQVRRVA